MEDGLLPSDAFTQQIIKDLTAGIKDLTQYVSIDKIVSSQLDNNTTTSAMLEEDMNEELGITEERFDYAHQTTQSELNAIESEVSLCYGVIRQCSTTIIATGFGGYYNKLSITEMLVTREFSSIWGYFSPVSILLVLGQIDSRIAEIKNKEISDETNKHK